MQMRRVDQFERLSHLQTLRHRSNARRVVPQVRELRPSVLNAPREIDCWCCRKGLVWFATDEQLLGSVGRTNASFTKRETSMKKIAGIAAIALILTGIGAAFWHEHREREAAVLGARLDGLFLQVGQLNIMIKFAQHKPNARLDPDLKDARKELARAGDSLRVAQDRYQDREWENTRTHLYNATAYLDRAVKSLTRSASHAQPVNTTEQP